MTPLNQHIRQLMLAYPRLYPNRDKVLEALYCSSGFDWQDGRIVNPHQTGPFDEEAARAAFFDDIDAIDPRKKEHALLRARRQLDLDTLDLRVFVSDRFYRPDTMLLIRSYSRKGWLAMNVPEDAEESYRDGALEVLKSVCHTLRNAGLQGHPLLIEIGLQIDTIDPRNAEMSSLVLEVLGQDLLGKDEAPVNLGAIERQCASYCIPMEVEDFLVLCKADDALCGGLNPTLLERLDGDPRKGLREIEGVSSIEYDGHFGAAVHYTVDAEDDLPDIHSKIRLIIADQVRRARVWAAEQSDKEAK